MIKLKPCPFCGSDRIQTATGDFARVFILCSGCGARMVSFGSMSECAALWNRRVKE